MAVTPERLISRILKFEMTSRKASMRLGTSDSSMMISLSCVSVSYTHLTHMTLAALTEGAARNDRDLLLVQQSLAEFITGKSGGLD